jgi:GR25 family glycosyltransferase involved in LPS biosynthesis
LLQLKENGGEFSEGSFDKNSAQALQDAALAQSVCGGSDKTGSSHCRMRGEAEAALSEKRKQVDGETSIADPAEYPCFRFGVNLGDPNKIRTFRDPIFPTGTGWPHLYRGRTEIPGLENARVYVVSLPDAELRRHHFARQWAALNLKMPAVWVEGVNGADGSSSTPFQDEFLNRLSPEDQRTHKGKAACWESHAGILSGVDGATAVILEDDVAFIQNFTTRFKEFIGSLPADWDMLHIGGDTFWDPPFAEKPKSWLKTRSASRTWGYSVRDSAVPRLKHANEVTMDLRAIDTFYGGLSFACEDAYAMNTYAPTEPFVLGTSRVSATDMLHPHTNEATRQLFATEEFDAPKSSQYTWFPSTCCNLPNVKGNSFKDWCCKRTDPKQQQPFCSKTS